VLSFERARNVYDKLLVDEIWTNAAAMKEIAQWLDRKKLLAEGVSHDLLTYALEFRIS
jgi:hypothetical protein